MKNRAILAAFALFGFSCLLFPQKACSFYLQKADEIYLSGDFDEDVFLFGSKVNFDGTIRSDLIAAGRAVVFDGTIDGNLHIGAERSTVNGSILRSFRGFARTITVNSVIEGDVTAFAQEVIISSDTRIGRDCAIFASEVWIDGTVNQDLYIYAGRVDIGGKIGGNVKIKSDNISIGSTTIIGGTLDYESKEKAKIAPEATILGETKWRRKAADTEAGGLRSFVPPPKGPVWSFFFFVGSIILGAVIILSRRNGVMALVEEIRRNAIVDGLVGAAVILFTPILIILFAILVVGIPIALVVTTAYGLIFLTAKIFCGIALGYLLFLWFRKEKTPSLGWSLVIGMIVLALLFKVPVLGWIVYLAAWAIGAGAMTILFFRRNRGQSAATSPPQGSSAGG